jgi:hypothetical protein
MDDLCQDILSLLCQGEDQRVARGDLLRILRQRGYCLKDDRLIREAIEELRCRPEGAYICSSPRGGYYIGTFEDVKRYLKSENSRANSLKRRTRLQLKRVQQRYRQTELF